MEQMEQTLEKILQRMKNRSMSGSENLETPENSRDSDVCPLCNGTEWILTEKDGITTVSAGSGRRCQGGCGLQTYRKRSGGWI